MKVIALIDNDAFYSQCEIARDPERLAGQPVVVVQYNPVSVARFLWCPGLKDSLALKQQRVTCVPCPPLYRVAEAAVAETAADCVPHLLQHSNQQQQFGDLTTLPPDADRLRPNSNGGIIAVSYEARKYGVKR